MIAYLVLIFLLQIFSQWPLRLEAFSRSIFLVRLFLYSLSSLKWLKTISLSNSDFYKTNAELFNIQQLRNAYLIITPPQTPHWWIAPINFPRNLNALRMNKYCTRPAVFPLFLPNFSLHPMQEGYQVLYTRLWMHNELEWPLDNLTPLDNLPLCIFAFVLSLVCHSPSQQG